MLCTVDYIFQLRPEPLVGYKLSRVALGTRMVQIRENYLKVAQDIFWSQKLCFDERRLFFFLLNGVHATRLGYIN